MSSLLSCFAEIPIEFIVPLKDISVLERQNVKLEVKVNKPNVTLTWMKDGTVLTPSERIDIEVDGQVRAWSSGKGANNKCERNNLWNFETSIIR
jgi:predicted membrane GTPase involved in stress response